VNKRLTLSLLQSLCLCAAAPARATAQGQVISAKAGVVTRVIGESKVRRHGADEPSRLQAGDELRKGDLLLTGEGGHVELTLNVGSYLRVGPLARVWVHEVEDNQIHFDILRGDVSAIVGRLPEGLTLILDTPPAELHIIKRGHYVVRVAADGAEAYVAEGALSFTDAGGQTIRLGKHRRARFAMLAKR
jgi:hypothetical protein